MEKINDFIQNFGTQGFSRSNLFNVQITADFINTEQSKMLTYGCLSCQVPGITFNESSYGNEGYTQKFVSSADFDPVTLTFYLDENNIIKDLFDEWKNKIFDDQGYGYKDEYISEIVINRMKRDGTEYDTTKIIEAYPTNIEPIDLSWDSRDEVSRLAVSFNYLKIK
jgi:hypothetical protein